MRASREVRRWADRIRAKYGKPNGVVPAFAFDVPEFERKHAKSRKRRLPLPTQKESRE